MKMIPLSLLIAIAATVLPVSAQEQPQPNARPPRARIQPVAAEDPAAFPGNVKLTFEGNLFGAVPTDLSILSGGPSFATDLLGKAEGETPIMGSLEGVLTPGPVWTVQIVLSARVPVKIGGTNIEYRDCRFRTSARVASGKKVTLWEKDGQKLVLGLEEVSE
jgi:hypothetical protein